MKIRHAVIAVIIAGISTGAQAAELLDLQQTLFLKAGPNGDVNLVKLLLRNDDTTRFATLSFTTAKQEPITTQTELATGSTLLPLQIT